MPQYARPTADIIHGDWDPTPSSPNTVWDKIDDNSDIDYITGIAGGVACKVQLSALSWPGSTGWKMRIRGRRYSTSGTVTVNLYRHGTPDVLITTWDVTFGSTLFATFTHDLTEAEANAIGTYCDNLHYQFDAGGSAGDVAIAWAELEASPVTRTKEYFINSYFFKSTSKTYVIDTEIRPLQWGLKIEPARLGEVELGRTRLGDAPQKTKGYGLDILIKKLDIQKINSVSSYFRKTFQKTVSVSTNILKHVPKIYTTNSIFKKLRITKTYTTDTRLKKLSASKTYTINSLLKKFSVTKTYTLSAHLEKGFTKSYATDTHIGLILNTDARAGLARLGLTRLSFGKEHAFAYLAQTLLKKLNFSKTHTVSTRFEKVFTKTYATSVYLRKGLTKTYSSAVHFKQQHSKTYGVDTHLGLILNTDARLGLATLGTSRLSFEKERAKGYGIHTLIRRLNLSKSYTVSTRFEKVFTKTYTIRTYLKKQVSKTYTVQLYIVRKRSQTYSIDVSFVVIPPRTNARLGEAGIGYVRLGDSIEQSKQYEISALLQKFGFSKTYTTDTQIKYVGPYEFARDDAILGTGRLGYIGLSWYHGRTVGYGTSTLFFKSDVQKTYNISSIFTPPRSYSTPAIVGKSSLGNVRVSEGPKEEFRDDAQLGVPRLGRLALGWYHEHGVGYGVNVWFKSYKVRKFYSVDAFIAQSNIPPPWVILPKNKWATDGAVPKDETILGVVDNVVITRKRNRRE